MKVLVVDDERTLRLTLRMTLESNGHEVVEAEDGEVAVRLVSEQGPFDAVFLDVNMPRMNGIEALKNVKKISPQTFCVVATAYSDVKDAVEAIKYDAFDYIEKPVDPERVISLMDAAKEANALVKAAALSAPQVNFAEGRAMIGGSSQIQKVFGVIHKLSQVETSVLIRGESGTGKELVARALHFNSHRRKGPFVAVNCAAIPENLIESELFGHEKGAFTGADKKKIGKFQFAQGGTIFLDEIGDVSQSMQVKLLRVLQEKVISPVGGNSEHKFDARIVAATSRPLEKMIEQGTFRPDLFYRLNVLPIVLPPLRERREDILPLSEFMVTKFNKVHNKKVKKIDARALDALRMYAWPGNIRELENVIEHSFIMVDGDVIGVDALPLHIQNEGGQKQTAAAVSSTTEGGGLISDFSELNFPVLKERFEKEFILHALKTFDGRINKTAEQTKMTKVTLLRKLEKFGIDPKEFHRH